MAFFEELGKKAQAVAGVAAEKAKDLAGVASEKAIKAALCAHFCSIRLKNRLFLYRKRLISKENLVKYIDCIFFPNLL